MSAFNHLEYRLEELATEVQSRARNPVDREFGKHLEACAMAAIALSDAMRGYEDRAVADDLIRKVLGPERVLESLIDGAHEALRNLQAGLEWAGRGRPPRPAYPHGPRAEAQE